MPSDTGITSSLIGALAGGVVGMRLGKGKMATAASAVIGAVGANQLEKTYDRHLEKEKQREERPEKSRRRRKRDGKKAA